MGFFFSSSSLYTPFEIFVKRDYNSRMIKEENKPYGYIYVATNRINGKVYVGQTITSRWGDRKIPIEERWNREIQGAHGKKRRGEGLRYIENAILKYGRDNFALEERDTANDQEELDSKERHWIKELDAMNREKGYNMTEGGLGGRPSQEVREKLRDISLDKWHNDPKYIEKQLNARKELGQDQNFREKMIKINQEKGKDPKFREKMIKINQEKGRNPKFQEKVSNVITKKWDEDPEYRKKQEEERKARAKDPDFINKMSEVSKKNWKDPAYQQKQKDSHDKFKKKIENKKEFIDDVKNGMLKKDMLDKYKIGKNSYNKRIQEMFGLNGPKNHTELKNYLQGKDVNDVLKDIEKRESGEQGEKSLTESGSEESKGKTSENLNKSGIGVNYRNLIDDKREFLNDIKKGMSQLDISDKYNIDGSTLNLVISDMFGETGPRSHKSLYHYLQNTDIDDVIKDIKEREQDSEMRYDKNLPNENNFAESEESQINLSSKDYEGIDQTQAEKGADFKGINELDDGDSAKDYNNLEDTPPERGIDFDGIDKPQEKGDRDFENLDEGQPEGGVESGEGP